MVNFLNEIRYHRAVAWEVFFGWNEEEEKKFSNFSSELVCFCVRERELAGCRCRRRGIESRVEVTKPSDFIVSKLEHVVNGIVLNMLTSNRETARLLPFENYITRKITNSLMQRSERRPSMPVDLRT